MFKNLSKESELIIAIISELPVRKIKIENLSNLDWDTFLRLVDRSRLSALAYKYFKKKKILSKIPEEVASKLKDNYRVAQIRAKLQFQWTSEVLNKLVESGKKAIVIKGLSTQYNLYEEPALRVGKDMDLLILKKDVPFVKEMFFSLNYMHGALMPNGYFIPATKEQVDEVEQKHFELGYLVKQVEVENLSKKDKDLLKKVSPSAGLFYTKEDTCYFYSVFDVHWNLFYWFDPDEIFEASIERNVNGEVWNCISNEWNLLFSAFKVYFESFDHFGGGLHHLVDMVKVIEQKNITINWSYLFDLIDRYQLHACAYYVFSHLTHTLGLELPTLVLDKIKDWKKTPSNVMPKQVLDLGDFFPFALGERMI